MKIKITYMVNGGEYKGFFIAECNSYEEISDYSVKLDNVVITMQEMMLGIEKVEGR